MDDLPGLIEAHNDKDEEDTCADVIKSHCDTSAQHTLHCHCNTVGQ